MAADSLIVSALARIINRDPIFAGTPYVPFLAAVVQFGGQPELWRSNPIDGHGAEGLAAFLPRSRPSVVSCGALGRAATTVNVDSADVKTVTFDPCEHGVGPHRR